MSPTRLHFTARPPLARNKWYRLPRPDPAAALRLWCLPFAGGAASIWYAWSAPLAGTAEIAAVCLPGREDRLAEPHYTRADELASVLADQIAPFAGEPFALCGHSLGALLAYGVARELRNRGLAMPGAIVVLAAQPPHLPPMLPLLHGLPRNEFIGQIEKRYGKIPPEIRDHPDFLDMLLPTLRADLEIYETYAHAEAPALNVPLLALGGVDDAIVPRADILAWRAHTTASFEAGFFPGGHFFPQANLVAVASRVRDFLRANCGAGTRDPFEELAVPY